MMTHFANSSLLAQLEALYNGAGMYASLKLRLFKDDITPDANTTYATLAAAEADYAGYAAEDITFDAPTKNDVGLWIVTSTLATFRPTSDATPNSIWGFFVTTAANALVMSGRVGIAPLPMLSEDDEIKAVVLAPTGSTGEVIVIS